MLDSLSTPLSKEELDDFGNYLESIPGAMNLERVHGFLTSLQCSPQLVFPSNFFPYILGNDHVFDSNEDLNKYTGAILRLWEGISRQLNDGFFMPLLRNQSNGKFPGNEWSEGFLDGMKLVGRDWRDLIDDDVAYNLITPIFALGHEFDPDPECRTAPGIDEENRETMITGIKVFVPKIFEYFTPKRSSVLNSARNKQVPVRRASQKIGRNDPCPCKSGEKYKKCCGKS
ncbi:MAG: UPF0149 family protein [Solidesulfovibrio sp. DCME]|uniref:UPF0149 family protein n=1 Tax=Solidesulfovibrio sp. DCME TaxID=3447380 RepID=UPI003D0C28FF